MLQHDIEITRMMAEAWRLNAERNKQAAMRAIQSAQDKRRYAPIDDPIQE